VWMMEGSCKEIRGGWTVMDCSGAVCVDDGRVMQGDPWLIDGDGL